MTLIAQYNSTNKTINSRNVTKSERRERRGWKESKEVIRKKIKKREKENTEKQEVLKLTGAALGNTDASYTGINL